MAEMESTLDRVKPHGDFHPLGITNPPNHRQQPPPAAKNHLNKILGFGLLGGLFLGLGLFLAAFYYFPTTTVIGESMSPTLTSGSMVVLQRDSAPHDGDIVIFKSPTKWKTPPEVAKSYFIKRLVGLPGEAYSFRAGQVTVNGKTYPVNEPCKPLTQSGLVPPGTFLAFGDNSQNSFDSRHVLCTGGGSTAFIPLTTLKAAGHLKHVFLGGLW